MRTLLIASLTVAGLIGPATAQPRAIPHPEWAKHFQAEGIAPSDGALVLYDEARDIWHRFNPARCATGYLPASTFKIFNTMAGVEAGIIPDAGFHLDWDGVPRQVPDWNQDLDLTQAFRVSAVWFYQAIARGVGPERMQAYLTREGYGNASMEGGLTTFWLTGSLRISPDAQIDFLRRLRHGRLGFPAEAQALTREVMRNSETPSGTVYGKTGLASGVEGQDIGWWVGYVDTPKGNWYFALAIATRDPEAPLFASRKRIVNRVLTDFKLPTAL